MSERAAIEAVGVTKSYGATRALSGVSLQVLAGQILALLGPNGAGKTTTVRVLTTLTRPDAGSARVAGYDVISQRHEVRRRISLTGQSSAVDALQTGVENLTMLGRLRGLPSRAAQAGARELLEIFGLADAADRRVAGYSGGMRRRLDLAAGLIGRPEVLFLDEPTTGLDPVSRWAMWTIVEKLAATGTTVLMTTQQLDEADRLADRIVLIDHGRVVAEGTPADLKQRVASRRLEVVLADPLSFDAATQRLGGRVIQPDRSALTFAVATGGGAAEIRGLLDEIDPQRSRISRFAEHRTSLDDVFAALTGPQAAIPVMENAHA
jgi:ABC-2 type transport system ATP-binding protein